MEYKKLVSIVGKPGLWEIVNQRPDGLIARPIGEGKTQFISSRLNQFTLLENISIYTDDDVETLEVIFQSMIDKKKTLPVPEKSSSNQDIKDYFKEILPNYDEEKVYVSDMKKVIKWYNILKDHDIEKLLKEKKEEEEKEKKEKEKEAKKDSKAEKAEAKTETKKKASKSDDAKSETVKKEAKAESKKKSPTKKASSTTKETETIKAAETKTEKAKKTTKKTATKKTDKK